MKNSIAIKYTCPNCKDLHNEKDCGGYCSAACLQENEGREYKPEDKVEIVKAIIDAMSYAQFGSEENSKSIDEFMKEYFTRWPSYKSRFTSLEWYHIFLEFAEYTEKVKPITTEGESQEELIKKLWSLWESLAECGEIHIGKGFNEKYDTLKRQIKP